MNRNTTKFFLCGVVFLLAQLMAGAVEIDTVPVGNAGNANHPETGNLYGGVGYDYRIGTTEVTNTQYAEYLNTKAASDPLGLYNTRMGTVALNGGITRAGLSGSYTYTTITGRENMPVVHVDWYDAIRFANWLNNGQGSGSTENGAYTILGGTPVPSNGASITRNSSASWFLTSEDEWYKAAYYDAGSDTYYRYPTSTDTTPIREAPPGGINSANYWFANNDLNEVDAYTDSKSPYGAFGQGGNAQEWNESQVGDARVLRGGAWNGPSGDLRTANRLHTIASAVMSNLGFRVAFVPEPSTLTLAAFGFVALAWGWRRRKGSLVGPLRLRGGGRQVAPRSPQCARGGEAHRCRPGAAFPRNQFHACAIAS